MAFKIKSTKVSVISIRSSPPHGYPCARQASQNRRLLSCSVACSGGRSAGVVVVEAGSKPLGASRPMISVSPALYSAATCCACSHQLRVTHRRFSPVLRPPSLEDSAPSLSHAASESGVALDSESPVASSMHQTRRQLPSTQYRSRE